MTHSNVIFSLTLFRSNKPIIRPHSVTNIWRESQSIQHTENHIIIEICVAHLVCASEDISLNANTRTERKKNQFQSVDEFHENETIHEWEGHFQDKNTLDLWKSKFKWFDPMKTWTKTIATLRERKTEQIRKLFVSYEQNHKQPNSGHWIILMNVVTIQWIISRCVFD